MSTFRNPVGPESPTVYRRRRLVVGAAALAVFIIILLIVFSPRGGAPKTPVAVTSGAATTTTAPTGASTNPADAPACNPASLTVTAISDKATYAAADKPQLSFTVTNNGAVPCSFSGGSDVQEYKITSGKEVYWDSKDCQSAPVAQKTVIPAGQQVGGGPIAWDRTRSSTTTCTANRTAVPAKGASYHLEVTVGGVVSKVTRQFILS